MAPVTREDIDAAIADAIRIDILGADATAEDRARARELVTFFNAVVDREPLEKQEPVERWLRGRIMGRIAAKPLPERVPLETKRARGVETAALL